MTWLIHNVHNQTITYVRLTNVVSPGCSPCGLTQLKVMTLSAYCKPRAPFCTTCRQGSLTASGTRWIFETLPAHLILGIKENFNSSPPSAAYMRQWIVSVLAQILACRLFGAKPLSKPTLGYCQLVSLGTKILWKFDENTKLFIHENISENVVCEMAAILARGWWVKRIGYFRK